MNLQIKILTCFLFFILPVGFTAGQECKTKVNIKTDLDNSLIYINHKLAGNGNISTELGKGIYDITVMTSGKKWESEIFNNTLLVNSCGRDTSLVYLFRKQVYLNSDPQDAEVYMGDSLIGYTPLFISSEIPQLTLRKSNYQSRQVSQNDFADGSIVKLNFTGREEAKSFYERPVFKYLVGGILAFGAATAYFKIKADKAFSDYQRTQKQASLDTTHRYDLISGITFGALQINLGMLIYYFLAE